MTRRSLEWWESNSRGAEREMRRVVRPHYRARQVSARRLRGWPCGDDVSSSCEWLPALKSNPPPSFCVGRDSCFEGID